MKANDMERFPDSQTGNQYVLPTIGGIFGKADHDRLLISREQSQFDGLFPPTLRGKTRALYETGIDALAAILCERTTSCGPIRLWAAENFCHESLERLRMKQEDRIQFLSYRHVDDLRNLNSTDVVLYLHFNRYDPASRATIAEIKQLTGATVIEDFVQAPLDIARFSGDAAFNSLRKFSSVDVAVAYQQDPPALRVEETHYRLLRKEAEQIRSQFLDNPTAELELRFLKLGRESDTALAVPEISSAHPREIERARNFDFKTAQSLRRINYTRLAQKIGTQNPEIKILPGDYMYLMVRTEHRDRLRASLFSERVFPVIHWADSGCDQVRSLLSFHIDQRYSLADMDRVVDVIGNSRLGFQNIGAA